jgi:hypothetical protein
MASWRPSLMTATVAVDPLDVRIFSASFPEKIPQKFYTPQSFNYAFFGRELKMYLRAFDHRQTTDTNLGKDHCLALRAPTLALCIEITKSSMFVIQGFIWITKF